MKVVDLFISTVQVKIASVLHQEHKIAISEMAVLTPYTAQKEKIKKLVQKKAGDLKNLRVSSINESQGSHASFFFFCMCETLDTGFLLCRK